jgi:acylphosphatase
MDENQRSSGTVQAGLRSARFMLRGRVQGVGMRVWAKRTADRLELRGWIRNNPDGRVEVNVEGSVDAMRRFRQLLRSGPRLARVVEMIERGPAVDLPEEGFEIRT